MKQALSLLALALALSPLTLSACASAPSPSLEASATRPRRHRRPRAPVAQPAPTDNHVSGATPDAGTLAQDAIAARAVVPPRGEYHQSFGTPVVHSVNPGAAFSPRWDRDRRRHVLRCLGDVPPQVPSSQSPLEPSVASVVQNFHPVERAIAACAPPSTPNGRLPVRGVFHGSGVPREFNFPQMPVTESQALCLGRSLCQIRLPVFRSVNAPVRYDFLVYLP